MAHMAPKSTSKVKVRQARRTDISALVELNRVCYPTMAEDDVVWGRTHLESHQRVFPQGQMVATIDPTDRPLGDQPHGEDGE